MRNLGILIPIIAVSAWPIIAIVSMVLKTRVRELEIRERIAMIEKGLVPPPEKDPAGFDRAMDAYDRRYRHPAGGRHFRTGIILVTVGFGMMLLIGVAGHETNAAVGVGGFIVLLGLAFLVIGVLEQPRPAANPGPAAKDPAGPTAPTAPTSES